MNRAYLIVGPESSGNRHLASVLIAAGCAGKADTVQPWDGPGWSIVVPEPRPERLVVVRSFPHAGVWLKMITLVQQLRRQGYEPAVLWTQRNPAIVERSQVRAGHVATLEDARRNIQRAHRKITEGLFVDPSIRVHAIPYGVTRSRVFRRWLVEVLGLPREPPGDLWRDEDAKWEEVPGE